MRECDDDDNDNDNDNDIRFTNWDSCVLFIRSFGHRKLEVLLIDCSIGNVRVEIDQLPDYINVSGGP